jgi:hypothetical protein
MAKKGASGDASDWDKRTPNTQEINFSKYKASDEAKKARYSQQRRDYGFTDSEEDKSFFNDAKEFTQTMRQNPKFKDAQFIVPNKNAPINPNDKANLFTIPKKKK